MVFFTVVENDFLGMKKTGGNSSFYVMYRGINLKFYITIDIYRNKFFFYYSGPDTQKQYEANLSDWVLLFWESIPICIRYLCWVGYDVQMYLLR